MIDREKFLYNFRYFDNSVIIEIIDLFIDEYPGRIDTFNKCLQDKDYPGLKFAAHSLKGVISNFSVPELQEKAKEMEFIAADKMASKDISHEVFEEKYKVLQQELAVFVQDLKEIKNNL